MILGLGLALATAAWALQRRARRPRNQPGRNRLTLLLLLVELRSGSSVLGGLMAVSSALPEQANLGVVARIGAVSGLTRAVSFADEGIRPIVSHLARSQRSGASLTETVRGLLEQDLVKERASRLARARSLPVKLMIPITLLMLPGLVLMTYAPSLLDTVDGLLGSFG